MEGRLEEAVRAADASVHNCQVCCAQHDRRNCSPRHSLCTSVEEVVLPADTNESLLSAMNIRLSSMQGPRPENLGPEERPGPSMPQPQKRWVSCFRTEPEGPPGATLGTAVLATPSRRISTQHMASACLHVSSRCCWKTHQPRITTFLHALRLLCSCIRITRIQGYPAGCPPSNDFHQTEHGGVQGGRGLPAAEGAVRQPGAHSGGVPQRAPSRHTGLSSHLSYVRPTHPILCTSAPRRPQHRRVKARHMQGALVPQGISSLRSRPCNQAPRAHARMQFAIIRTT